MLAYAGISYRQLDHWCTKGWIDTIGRGTRNPGSGQQREFTTEQANKAKLMWCLSLTGFKTDVAERIANHAVKQNVKSFHLGHGVTVLIEPHTHKE